MRYAVFVIAIVILALLVMEFNERSAELRKLEAQEVLVKAEKMALENTKAALLDQIAQATSAAAVEEYGYTSHLGRDGDVRVVGIAISAGTPTPTATPIPQPTQKVSNWQRWWWVFFGQLQERQQPSGAP